MGFVIRKQDLHSKHPRYGMRSAAELRDMGYAIDITVSTGLYVAATIVLLLTALTLVSLVHRQGRIARP